MPDRSTRLDAAHRAGRCSADADARGFALAWEERDDDRPLPDVHIEFARVVPDGNRGAITRLAVPERVLHDPRVAWSGDGYGLVFRGNNRSHRDPRYEVYFAALDADGRPRGATVMLSELHAFSDSPRIAWRDGAFSVAWVEPVRRCVRLGRVARDGRWLDAPRCVHADNALSLELAAHQSRDLLAWIEPRTARDLSTIRWLWPETPTHARAERRLVRTLDGLDHLHIAPSRQGPHTFWVRHAVDEAMYLEHAAPSGGGDEALPYDTVHHDRFVSAVTAAAHESAALLAWTGFQGRAAGIFVAPFAEGALRGSPRWHGTPEHFAGAPWLAHGAAGFGMCWLDGRDGGARVYFASLARDGTLAHPPRPVSE